MSNEENSKSLSNKQSICEYCKCTFEQKVKVTTNQKEYRTKNKTCSRFCAKQLQTHKRRLKNPDFYWSKAEVDYLIFALKRKPLKLIIEQWNDRAFKNNWKTRSGDQIRNKVNRLKNDPRLANNVFEGKGRVTRIRPTLDNWCLQDLKRIFKIKRFERILRWVHKKGLPYQDINFNGSKGYYIVKKADLIEFALSHPDEFWGIEKKDLTKIFPNDLALYLFKLNRERQPTNGRALPIVRLDKKEYYRSATKAATALNLSICTVRNCAKRDRPLSNGMDFFTFDYPVYWIPSDVVEEFNAVASELVYEFYLDLSKLSGYKKQSCLVVAARCAVQVTLSAFRRRDYEGLIGQELTAKQVLIDKIKSSILKQITKFLPLNFQTAYKNLSYLITRRLYHSFYGLTSNKEKALAYCEEFIHFFIEKRTRGYHRTLLPIDYVPRDKLQWADYWGYLTKSIFGNIYLINKKGEEVKLSLLILDYLSFVRKYKLEVEEQKATRYIEEWSNHNNCQENTDSKLALEQLLEKAKEKYSKSLVEKLELFVTMKLEEASDLEIADCLKVKSIEVESYYKMLASCY